MVELSYVLRIAGDLKRGSKAAQLWRTRLSGPAVLVPRILEPSMRLARTARKVGQPLGPLSERCQHSTTGSDFAPAGSSSMAAAVANTRSPFASTPGVELRMALKEVGFSQVRLYGSLEGTPYDHTADCLGAVAS